MGYFFWWTCGQSYGIVIFTGLRSGEAWGFIIGSVTYYCYCQSEISLFISKPVIDPGEAIWPSKASNSASDISVIWGKTCLN